MAETVTANDCKKTIQPEQRTAPKSRFPLRLISSTSIITVLLFMLINFAVEKFDPLERLYWTGLTGASQHIFVSKLPRLLTSSTDPDVLILGSSVSLFPAVRADDAMAGRKARWDFWYERSVILPYDKALFLESNLSKWSGKPVSVSNASVAGSLVSDQDFLLNKFISAGKKTKLLILCLSPRDFIDNARTDIKSTPTYNALRDWNSVPELIAQGASWQSIMTVSLGHISNYYRHRQEYNQFLTNLAAKKLHRPVNLFEATAWAESEKAPPVVTPADGKGKKEKKDTFFNPTNAAVYKQPPNTLYHLSEYKQMYLPVNEKQFEVQTKAFNNFLSLAKQKGIPVLVVRTPLPKENTDLLSAKDLERYNNLLRESCKAHGASLLEPDSAQPYDTAKDFEDASHMNTSGGIKYYTAIFETIKNDSKIAAGISQKPL